MAWMTARYAMVIMWVLMVATAIAAAYTVKSVTLTWVFFGLTVLSGAVVVVSLALDARSGRVPQR